MNKEKILKQIREIIDRNFNYIDYSCDNEKVGEDLMYQIDRAQDDIYESIEKLFEDYKD